MRKSSQNISKKLFFFFFQKTKLGGGSMNHLGVTGHPHLTKGVARPPHSTGLWMANHPNGLSGGQSNPQQFYFSKK